VLVGFAAEDGEKTFSIQFANGFGSDGVENGWDNVDILDQSAGR